MAAQRAVAFNASLKLFATAGRSRGDVEACVRRMALSRLRHARTDCGRLRTRSRRRGAARLSSVSHTTAECHASRRQPACPGLRARSSLRWRLWRTERLCGGLPRCGNSLGVLVVMWRSGEVYVAVVSDENAPPGDVVAAVVCGMFRRADGDHKFVAVTPSGGRRYAAIRRRSHRACLRPRSAFNAPEIPN